MKLLFTETAEILYNISSNQKNKGPILKNASALVQSYVNHMARIFPYIPQKFQSLTL